MFEAGVRICVRADPGRKGVLTGRSRERGGRILQQVSFPDGVSYMPEDQLECLPDVLDPIDLLRKGRLGRASDLRRNLTHIRLSGRLANLIYSMETTNTDYYPYQFFDGYHPELERLKDLDEEFLKDVCHPVRGTVALTKTNRDPNSEKWVEGLPIFLCGGGSQVEFYNPKMIKRVEEELAKNFKWNGFRQSTIPKPENLKAEGLHSRDYHRLSVAYGLSFPIDDIGKIVPPSEVDDIKKQPRVREYEFISKDQV